KVMIYMFCLFCHFISQPVSLQTLNLGDSATIECYIKSLMTKRVWYKLTTERKLHHLNIAATSWDDVGTYFCGVMHLNDIQFGSGTFLMLKVVWFPFQGAKMISDSVVQQPESQSVQSGDSVTLSCSVHSGQCPAEHISVMWLKNSDHSAPEMIYSPGNENTCQTVSGVASCVNNLLIRNFSDDGAGIYHCVVTSCGQILFGNGTKLISDCKFLTDVAELKYFIGSKFALGFLSYYDGTQMSYINNPCFYG
uniref:Ig-like domain-containing protein n=1 Tax=Amphiprion percula TaxID=161767 RepID=A0A3P8TPQ5_AMPPE